MSSSNTDHFFSELQKYRTEEKVVEFYDKYARDYDVSLVEEGYDRITEYAADMLRKLISEKGSELTVENASILDVGCGSGMTGTALHKCGFKIFDGIDASQGMLDVAKEKHIYRNLMKGKLTETEKFDITDMTFDGLLCIGCITTDHIKVEDAVPEFFRLLKHGGIAVYTISPTLDKTKALESHLKYFHEKKFELLQIERKYYVDQMFGIGTYCHLYGIRKI